LSPLLSALLLVPITTLPSSLTPVAIEDDE
jgi:hypothetical protein